VSLRHEEPAAWAALGGGSANRRTVSLEAGRFGFLFRDSTLRIAEWRAIAVFKGDAPTNAAPALSLSYLTGTTRRTPTIAIDTSSTELPGALVGSNTLAAAERLSVGADPVAIEVDLTGNVAGDELEDILLCIRFSVA
jgi:hypothetical protein